MRGNHSLERYSPRKSRNTIREWMGHGKIMNSFAMAPGQEDGIADKQVNHVKIR